MNILQISAPKSGSYWLHSILSLVLYRTGIKTTSFIQQQPVFQKVQHIPLSFKGQAGVDMIDIEAEGCSYRISSIFREIIKDLDQYVNSTSLAWTHSSFCTTSSDVLPLFDKRICIVRDPRDRALSSARFAFTSYMKEHYPSSYHNPNAYLKGEYERLLEQWVWHTGNYLLHKDELDIHFIFYERLLLDFDQELDDLLKYLEISLPQEAREEIARKVHFSNMKDKSPHHLQKGQYGKWISQLSVSQKEIARETTGELLQMLNYAVESQPTQKQLPKLPENPDGQILRRMLEQIQWQELYPGKL